MGDRAGEGQTYGNLGGVYRKLGNCQEAIEYHNKHLSIAKEVGDRVGEGRAYGSLGNAYESLGNFLVAIEYHSKDLSISKEVGDRAGEGAAYSNICIAYASLGNFQEAIKYYNKRLITAKVVGDKDSEGGAYCNLGDAYVKLGNFEEAIECENKCLRIAKEVGDRGLEAAAYGNLGNAYEALGNFQKAIEYHSETLVIAKEMGDRYKEGRAYCNLGNAYFKLDDFQKAIEYHNEDLSIAKEVGDMAGEGGAYNNLAIVYLNLGNFQKGLECFQSSVKLFDIVRTSLKSEDALKIRFRDLYRTAYTGLWETLLELNMTDEALCAAERGRAQALEDGLKLQYGLTALPSESLEPEETISYILNGLTTTTVFLGVRGDKIAYWVIGKGNEVQFRQKEIEGGSADKDPITVMLGTTLKKIGAGVGVRCENRSLDESTDDSSSITGDDEELELVQTSQCTIDTFSHCKMLLLALLQNCVKMMN